MMAYPPPEADTQPRLAIVVDTEEEFDWNQPFRRDQTGVGHIPSQALAHEIYDPVGVVPTYVVGYPVATDAAAIHFLKGLRDTGRAEIGAHLHPWVTPPHAEAVTRANSYACNLPPALERAKIGVLTETIADAFGERPTAFKAGRHGFGPATAAILADLGYGVDCSFVPRVSFAGDGGPIYYDAPDQPFWLDEERGLLEIPVTSGFFGGLAHVAHGMQPLFDSRLAERLHLPGLLARTGAVTRTRLTPEGVTADEQVRLLDAMVARGCTTFTMVYHSPSLTPGHTPYVRSPADLDAFLRTIATVLGHFRDVIGGRFTTLAGIHAEALATRSIVPRAIAPGAFAH